MCQCCVEHSAGTERNRPEGTALCSDEPSSAESSHCWSAVGPPSHPSSHPLPGKTDAELSNFYNKIKRAVDLVKLVLDCAEYGFLYQLHNTTVRYGQKYEMKSVHSE